MHHISVSQSLCFLLNVHLSPIDWAQFALSPFEVLLLLHFQPSQSHVILQMLCKFRKCTACRFPMWFLPCFSTLQSCAISWVQWQLILPASYACNIHYSHRSLRHGLQSRCRKRTRGCQLSRGKRPDVPFIYLAKRSFQLDVYAWTVHFTHFCYSNKSLN